MYSIVIKKSAQKAIDNLPKKIADTLVLKINALKESPRPDGYKKLVGGINKYRIKSGDYRVVYSIFDDTLIIEVIRVAHRKDVYRNL